MTNINSHNNKQPAIFLYNSSAPEDLDESACFLVFEDGTVIISGPNPFELVGGDLLPKQQVWNENGDWIGADSEIPFRCVTTAAEDALGGRNCLELFDRYETGDYGTGDPGFAVYRIGEQTVWVIDDAVRTPDGFPPARDPSLSPGPQTLLLPEDY